jgi:hypothetical protein
MVYWHNKIKDEVRLCDFMKVIYFLNENDLLSDTFYKHHQIYQFYKELKVYQSEKAAMIDTCNKFEIGKATFYNIKKRFKII